MNVASMSLEQQKIKELTSKLAELTAAARLMLACPPCSDPDCCGRAIQNERATQYLRDVVDRTSTKSVDHTERAGQE